VATRSISYDARGNPLSESYNAGAGATQAVTLAYDGHGRMTGYARNGEVSLNHAYNGNDDRISTTTTSAATATPDTRRFVYAPDGQVLGEYGSSASEVRAEFIWISPEVGASGTFGGDDGLGGRLIIAPSNNTRWRRWKGYIDIKDGGKWRGFGGQ
jgi:YD repeat-containing protein